MEEKSLPFLIKAKITQSKYLNKLQINSHMEFQPKMITRALTASRSIDHYMDEMPSNQSLITGQNTSQRSKQKTTTGFQAQTQTTPVVSYPHINEIETIEKIPHTEHTEISIPNDSALLSHDIVPLQFPIKTNRCNSDTYDDPT